MSGATVAIVALRSSSSLFFASLFARLFGSGLSAVAFRISGEITSAHSAEGDESRERETERERTKAKQKREEKILSNYVQSLCTGSEELRLCPERMGKENQKKKAFARSDFQTLSDRLLRKKQRRKVE